VTLQELQAKIEQGSYRSDRAPAVPFTTFSDLLDRKPIKTTTTGQQCGATLTTGERVERCGKIAGHVWMTGEEHDWSWRL
jgi:hypothetical protein